MVAIRLTEVCTKFWFSWFSSITAQDEFVFINISGSIIDEADSVSLYPSNHPVVTADTDKHSEQETLSCMSDGDFALTHLYGYRNFLSDTEGKDVDQEELKVRVSSSKHCQVCYGVEL